MRILTSDSHKVKVALPVESAIISTSSLILPVEFVGHLFSIQ